MVGWVGWLNMSQIAWWTARYSRRIVILLLIANFLLVHFKKEPMLKTHFF